MISCPGCGGNIKFDISSQKMKCEYCQNLYDPYDFDSKTKDAEENVSQTEDFEVTIFSCPQCGGEILSTDNAAAGFCSFCGASTILYSRISHEKRPDFIIPFSKTKEDCKQSYAALMRKSIFAPNELKNPEYIDGFRGIYMPYWAFYITQKGELNLPAEKSYRRGDYVYTDHYQLEGFMDSYYKGISYDASSSFSDNISQSVAPFDVKGMKAFTPGFMSGFYADTADVDAWVYQSDAEAIALNQSLKDIEKIDAYKGVTIKTSKAGGNSEQKRLFTKTETIDRALFPVWFMSYRNKDRVAYVTINGQTGKVAADIPVEPKKYLLGSLILAIPFFFLLMMFTILPKYLMAIGGALALFASILYTSELSSIAKKDSFATDKGMLFLKNPAQAAQMQAKSPINIKRKKSPIVSAIFIVLCIQVGVSVLIPILSQVKTLISFVWPILVIGMVIVFAIGSKKMSAIPDSQSILGYIASSLAIILGAAITFFNPVYDIFYYIGTIFSLVSVALAFVDIIRYYNVLVTRQLPQFNKMGGDDRA